jgi:glycosyltransferase involved in cell wall biosynthesis
MENALVHPIGDVETLTRHLNALQEDRQLLERLRAACLRVAPQYTWTAAGERLLQVYGEVLEATNRVAVETV